MGNITIQNAPQYIEMNTFNREGVEGHQKTENKKTAAGAASEETGWVLKGQDAKEFIPKTSSEKASSATGPNATFINSNGAPSIGLPLGLDADSALVLLGELQTQTTQVTVDGMLKSLRNSQGAIKEIGTDRLKKTEEQQANQKEQLAKQKSNWLARLFMKIFAAIALVAVAVVTAVTAGAALAIAGAVIGAVVAAYAVADAAVTAVNYARMQQGKEPIGDIGQWVGKGLIYALSLGFAAFAKPEDIEKAASFVAGGVMVVLGIASAVMTMGASAGANVPAMLIRASKIAQVVSSLSQGATQIYQGAVGIELAKLRKIFSELEAYLQTLLANEDMQKKVMDEITEKMNEVLQALVKNISGVSSRLTTNSETLSRIAKNMA